MATSIPIVADNELVRTSWGNTVRSEISALDTAAVKKTGAHTMAGPLTVTNAVNTGAITANPVSGDICMTLRSTAPYIEWRSANGATRFGFLQGNSTTMNLSSDSAALAFGVSTTERMRLSSQYLLLGKTAPDVNAAGLELTGTGSTLEGRINSTTTASGNENLYLRHMSSTDASGQMFVHFTHASTGTTAGAITQGSGNTVTYGTSSDYRMKDDLGDIDDPVGRVMALAPRHLAWKEGGDEFDGFIAHEVQAVAPYAVTGTKDAVLPVSDEFNPGGIIPQQLDAGKLIPLLTAALQQAVETIGTLEARVAALEGAA